MGNFMSVIEEKWLEIG